MKLTSVLSVLVAAANAGKAFADADLVVVEEKTSFTFRVGSDDANPIPSPEKDAYVENCLQSSFNAIHDPKEYQLESILIDDESIDVKENPDSDLSSDMSSGRRLRDKHLPCTYLRQ